MSDTWPLPPLPTDVAAPLASSRDHRHPRARWTIVLLLLPGACSFSLNGADVNLSRDDLLFLAVRGSKTFGERTDEHPPSGFGHGIEWDVTGVDGRGEIDLGIGGTRFSALNLGLSYRLGWNLPDADLHFLVGPGMDILKLYDSENEAIEKTSDFLGARTGFEARWKVLPWLSPYARLSGALLESGSDSNQSELGLHLHRGGVFGLLLAYRWWNAEYHEAVNGFYSRTLDVRWKGVMLGARLDF